MKRFNFLVIGQNNIFGAELLKNISKTIRKNYIFQVVDMEEALTLLGRLQVDMVLVDLDKTKVNLQKFSQQFPDLLVIGRTKKMSQQSFPDPSGSNRIFHRNDFEASVIAELKNIRKEFRPFANTLRKKSGKQKSAASIDFKNFARLVAIN